MREYCVPRQLKTVGHPLFSVPDLHGKASVATTERHRKKSQLQWLCWGWTGLREVGC